ncbi:MAG: HAMP domain-containing sensor histidine kinase [Pseudomonadota bacterium]
MITASLVYLSLHLLLVRPMRRVTENMVAFQDDPESSPIYAATGKRSDEIGLAETALAEMEQGLRDSLRQQSRLAALGIAVSKINHDLRNILTTARLVSDSMADSADPRVRRVAPTLIKSIDRAVDLCARTLAFARGGEMRMETGRVSLPELFTEVRRSLVAPEAEEVDWMVTVPQDLVVQADREQLYRVLANLAQNAVEAGATQLSLTAGVFDDGESWYLRLSDNGPGLPPRARANLFKPFTGSARAGGSGLGLAIVREIVEAHGGRIALVESGPAGTTFALEMPGGVARPEPVEPPRQVAQG